jgi:hypothetical protein
MGAFFNFLTHIGVGWLARVLTPHPPSALCTSRYAAVSIGIFRFPYRGKSEGDSSITLKEIQAMENALSVVAIAAAFLLFTLGILALSYARKISKS